MIESYADALVLRLGVDPTIGKKTLEDWVNFAVERGQKTGKGFSEAAVKEMQSFANLSTKLMGAIFGITTLGGGLLMLRKIFIDLTRSGLELEQQVVRLHNAAASVGLGSRLATELEWTAAAMSRTSVLTRSTITGLMSMALQLGINADLIPRFTRAILDAGASLGRGPESIAQLANAAARAISSGTNRALRQMGLELGVLKFRAGDALPVIQAIESLFSGRSIADLETYRSELNLTANAWEELRQVAGKFLVQEHFGISVYEALRVQMYQYIDQIGRTEIFLSTFMAKQRLAQPPMSFEHGGGAGTDAFMQRWRQDLSSVRSELDKVATKAYMIGQFSYFKASLGQAMRQWKGDLKEIPGLLASIDESMTELSESASKKVRAVQFNLKTLEAGLDIDDRVTELHQDFRTLFDAWVNGKITGTQLGSVLEMIKKEAYDLKTAGAALTPTLSRLADNFYADQHPIKSYMERLKELQEQFNSAASAADRFWNKFVMGKRSLLDVSQQRPGGGLLPFAPGLDLKVVTEFPDEMHAVIRMWKMLQMGLKGYNNELGRYNSLLRDQAIPGTFEFAVTQGESLGKCFLLSEAYSLVTQALSSMVGGYLVGLVVGEKFSKQQLANTLKNLATEAASRSLFELAAGWAASAISDPRAPMHFASAKIYGIVAGVSAVAARALGAGKEATSAAKKIKDTTTRSSTAATPAAIYNIYVEGAGFYTLEQLARTLQQTLARGGDRVGIHT